MNEMTRNFMDLPASMRNGTTHQDNLFCDFITMNTINAAIGMKFVLTLPTRCAGAGNTTDMLTLPPISKTRTRERLRKLPPHVHACDMGGWLMFAAWDAGELKMMCNNWDTAWACVDRQKQRR